MKHRQMSVKMLYYYQEGDAPFPEVEKLTTTKPRMCEVLS